MWGLHQQDIDALTELFRQTPEIEEALLFGSRAIGNFSQGSDVDIALKGRHLTHRLVSGLGVYLNEETNMPYHFDLLLYSAIQNADLIAHIDRVGALLFSRVSIPVIQEPPATYTEKAKKKE